MDLNFTGKTAFVAGSSRGIGFAVARGFLQEGANVVVSGRNKASLDEAREQLLQHGSENRLLFVNGDLMDADAISDALSQTVATFGGIDCVVASVGGGVLPNDLDITPADWTEGFNFNLFSSTNLAVAAMPHLKKTQGSLIFISSIAGIEAIPASVPYSAAKAAIHSAAKAMSRALGPDNVRVNVVVPGNVIFPGGNWDNKMKSERREFFEKYIEAEVPMNRFGQPDEIANAVLFLSSTCASFITGATLVVDGGQTRTHH